jgi:hypothetical protein
MEVGQKEEKVGEHARRRTRREDGKRIREGSQ